MTDISLPGYFAIGALSPRERADVARQRRSDPQLDAQINAYEGMFAPLAGKAGDMEPPPELKARIMAAIMAPDHFKADGKQLNAFGAGKWSKPYPGVEVKRLWTEGPVLVRCAPAAIIPAHEHRAHEHLVILSGDYLLEGQRLNVGDHLSSPPGSRHDAGVTQTGCILLVYGV